MCRHSSPGVIGGAVPVLSIPAATAAVPGAKLYRSGSDLARKQQQQEQSIAAAAPATCISSASTGLPAATSAEAAFAAVESGRASSRVIDADAGPEIAAAAAAPAPAPAPQLAPITTISKKGRFVVTQHTPSSTACSTPKASMLVPPAASSTNSSFTGSCLAVLCSDGTQMSMSAAAAAAAAAWLEAAAAQGGTEAGQSAAAAPGSTAVVVTCPVCDTPHAVCATSPLAAAAATAVDAATCASGASTSAVKSPLPPASPKAVTAAHSIDKASGCESASNATAAAGSAAAATASSSTIVSPCKPPRGSNCMRYRLSSPSNTPRAESPLHTCASCGAPLPPVAAVVAGVVKVAEQGPAAAAAGATTGLPAVGWQALGAPAAAAAGRADAVQYAVVQPGDILHGTIPHGLLAEAATRVLAARQQQQQQSGLISPECSSSTVASGTALNSVAECCSARTSSSNTGLAGPAGAVLVSQAAVEVLPTPAWQLPHSHPLDVQLGVSAASGSSCDHQHSCCSSPVSSWVGPCDSATAAGVLPPAQQMLQPSAPTSPAAAAGADIGMLPRVASAVQDTVPHVSAGAEASGHAAATDMHG